MKKKQISINIAATPFFPKFLFEYKTNYIYIYNLIMYFVFKYQRYTHFFFVLLIVYI
jgi:hypothetical protein